MKVLFISLGCDKTKVDSEHMLGTLAVNGFEVTDDENEAEAAVINTCCFIADATAESIRTILPLAERRAEGSLKALIVAGCMAERFREEIFREIPEVDEAVGTSAFSEIANALKRALDGEKHLVFDKGGVEEGERVLSGASASAYLKIAEGCDKHCTYCVIPSLRGPYRSVPMERILDEARSLAGKGVKELILVAQETTRYGIDLYGEKSLPLLLKRLSREIYGPEWIRVLYCYPEEIDDTLMETIRTEEKVLPYLDIPVQSGSDRILKRMGRRTSASDIRTLVKKLRKEIPEICLRTTLITGFPGETAADHNETMELVRELRFDRLGVFTYSREDGTPASRMRGQIAEPLKKRRRTQLMKLQQQIAFEKSEERIGKVLPAMIEGRLTGEAGFIPADDEGDVYVARTYLDAPDVDGMLFVTGIRNERMSGDLVNVRITAAHGYDLIGTCA